MTKRELELLKLTERVERHSSKNTPIETFELVLDVVKLNMEILNRLEKYFKNEKQNNSD
jgi:hypothetical protein